MDRVETIIICAIDTLEVKTVSRALLLVYSLMMALLLLLTAPWWLWQMARTGKYRGGLGERLGRIPSRIAHPAGGCIWVHAVSVGEVLAASRLIEELQAKKELKAKIDIAPQAPNTSHEVAASRAGGLAVYVSTTTRTGQTLARQRFGPDRVFYFPLDFAFPMRAWIRFLRPALVVLVESEFWPRMLDECRRAAIPVAVVNARVSDRSWPRYQRLKRLWRPILSSLATVLAQSETDAQRLRSLGAANAIAAGNLKYDIRVPAPAAITAAVAAQLPAEARLVVCGSTLAGEEELLLDALPLSEIITILAPRHPERFDEVARLLAERRIPHARRSTWLPGAPLTSGFVLLLDSIGELASVYSLATLAIVGGGFLWPGGHNPLEPAQFGVPILMGEQYANFRDVVEALRQAQAVKLAAPVELGAAVAQLLHDEQKTRAMGQRGQRVFEQEAGATGRALEALLALVPPAEPAGREEIAEAVR